MLKMKTIRSKLFLSYGAILLLVCIFFAVSYSVSKNIIQKSAATNSLNSVKIIGQDLNSELTYLFNLRDQIYNDSDVNFYINRLKRETDTLEKHYAYMKLNKILNDFTKNLIQNNKSCEIILYTDSRTTVYYSWDNQGAELTQIQQDIDILFRDERQACTVSRKSYNPSNPEEAYIYFYKSYQNAYNRLLDFYIIIGIPESTLTQYFDPLIQEDSSAALIDEEGTPILSSSPLSPRFINGSEKTQPSSQTSGYEIVEFQGKQYIDIYDTLDSIDWKLTHLMPMKDILKDLNTWTYAIVVSLLILSVCMFLICLYVNQRVARPIRKLDHDMQRVKQGELHLLPPETVSQDEIGRLSLQFYDMVSQIEILNQQMLQKEAQKRNLEIEALQAQINPHFIYNTINSIKMLLRLKRPEQVNSSLTALVDILKNTIARPEEMVTLEQEIKILKSYIYIQQTRYSNFQFSIDLPEELNSCRILRFLIQPFIENSLLHGFQEINDEVRISVAFRRLETEVAPMLEITVADNGIGMDGHTLKKITSAEKKTRGLNGIGVSNVIERVRLNFGEPYSVHFESEIGRGTRVILRLPLILSDPEEGGSKHGGTD